MGEVTVLGPDESGTSLALVTGAASGIGLAIAKRFLASGHGVIGVDMSSRPPELSDEVLWVCGDVASEQTWSDTAAAVRDSSYLGVSVVIPNAAIVRPAPIGELTYADLRAVLDVVVGGAFLAIKTFLPDLIRLSGSVVTIGSVDSFIGERGVAAYCAAKGALLQFTRSVALDLAAFGVRANCVCPGVTDTPALRASVPGGLDGDDRLLQRAKRNPIGRFIAADEIASVVYFLSSRDASGVTGSCWPVDGGLSASYE